MCERVRKKNRSAVGFQEKNVGSPFGCVRRYTQNLEGK